MYRKSVCLFTFLTCASVASAQERPAASPADGEAIRSAVAAYVETFNQRDAGAVASLWTETCVYIDRQTGTRAEGREAILADFTTLFKDRPQVVLDVETEHVRFVQPNVAEVDGVATVVYGDEAPNQTTFSALLVKSKDKWLLDRVEEVALPVPATAYDALKSLEWMVGEWKDESEDISVSTAVRWSAGNSFLVRSYTVAREDDVVHQGTQIIGWDPKAEVIRSWNFDSDGSFGNGVWSEDGETWRVELTQTLPEGRVASGTQIFTRDGDDAVTVARVAQDIDGEPIPSTKPVKVVRVAVEPPADAETSKTGGSQ